MRGRWGNRSEGRAEGPMDRSVPRCLKYARCQPEVTILLPLLPL